MQPNWIIYRKEEISLVKAVANKKGFGDKKRWVVIGWNFVETL